ncbi:hypothetical protein BDZ94DRAFT_1353138 [Collybia nuda]|uniref:CxC2-like cysteine cluster KDZ transposase-associated domain-containing protein n=1 Tax=Collybia nuda TaxID=64659 RepID=A0A9P6CCF4_9AGAR|nr:hypothetical protein BDZ94DRAFT_1353138 [Collybia nuda]
MRNRFEMDSNKRATIGLDFCECERAPSHSIQLLRARLYPATGMYPKTAASFKVLRQFHLLSFESKCSGYEFYNSLARLTDNSGSPRRDRYDEFMRMIRQWRHLKMLKRTGRGHDVEGVKATKPGQCAILCPACPQPDINLPPDWESAPDDESWKYALILSIDANFRLQRKRISSEERDPSLGSGWAFFVDEAEYKAYLAANWDHKQEPSTCMSHDAVNKPDREAQGLAASGAGTIDCARHNFKHPNGVGDLQAGERYINMDYLVFLSLVNSKIRIIVISYDIVCQWHKKLFDRMMSFPHHMHLSKNVVYILFLIPKFHLPAHIEDCNLQFLFNLTKNVGRTDGEAPECGWASINPVAQSTKEMGPGSRRDTLDNHFNDWNWKKTITFGERMLNKIQEAVPSRSEHPQALEDFEVSIPPAIIKEWKVAIEDWEKDASQPNPFKMKAKRLGLHPTEKQLTNILNRSNHLRQKIAAWTDDQALYMPHAAQERMRNVTDIRLYLPSALSMTTIVDKGLCIIEWKLREGQAYDALEEIRHVLHLRSHLYKHKDCFSRGVKANTRSNVAIENATMRINRASEKYKVARAALISLAPEHALRRLDKEDIHGLSEGLYGDTEGTRRPSWIWMSYGIVTNDGDNDYVMNEALRVEWCRARARAMRWDEEVELLQEEMRRILVFLEWQAIWWEHQGTAAYSLDSTTKEGMIAYANKQASLRLTL